MNLDGKQATSIEREAGKLLGSNDFNCIGFVRFVYRKVGIEIPPILIRTAPPREFNITRDQQHNPPLGHIVFLRNRFSLKEYRKWTHVVISLGDDNCIHCSCFYGMIVIISSLNQILHERYDFAPSEE